MLTAYMTYPGLHKVLLVESTQIAEPSGQATHALAFK